MSSQNNQDNETSPSHRVGERIYDELQNIRNEIDYQDDEIVAILYTRWELALLQKRIDPDSVPLASSEYEAPHLFDQEDDEDSSNPWESWTAEIIDESKRAAEIMLLASGPETRNSLVIAGKDHDTNHIAVEFIEGVVEKSLYLMAGLHPGGEKYEEIYPALEDIGFTAEDTKTAIATTNRKLVEHLLRRFDLSLQASLYKADPTMPRDMERQNKILDKIQKSIDEIDEQNGVPTQHVMATYIHILEMMPLYQAQYLAQ